jgi:hypothetical protein
MLNSYQTYDRYLSWLPFSNKPVVIDHQPEGDPRVNMQQRICPQCGTALGPQQSFCTNCGHHFPDPSMTAPTQQSSSSIPSPGVYSAVPSGAEPTKLATPNPTPPPPPPSYGSSPYNNVGSGNPGAYSTPPPPLLHIRIRVEMDQRPLCKPEASLPRCSHSRKKAPDEVSSSAYSVCWSS